MASQALLKAIPKGVHVARNQWIWDHFFVHTSIMNAVSLIATIWLASIPISRFPITCGPPQLQFRCVPDYASGKVVTLVRKNARYVSSI